MVMPWLFGIRVTLAVAAVIAVLVIDRRSSRRPDSAPRKRLVLPVLLPSDQRAAQG